MARLMSNAVSFSDPFNTGVFCDMPVDIVRDLRDLELRTLTGCTFSQGLNDGNDIGTAAK